MKGKLIETVPYKNGVASFTLVSVPVKGKLIETLNGARVIG